MFGRHPKTFADYIRHNEKERVLLGGIRDCPSYQGILINVTEDSYFLVNAQTSSETAKALNWIPMDGTVVVDRSKVLFVQLFKHPIPL
jgi:hypothetical protein